MSSFDLAYARLALVEGLYSNDPQDLGGETVCGIARKYWPKWDGWAQVDAAKVKAGFPASLKADVVLAGKVKTFYRENFWNVFGLNSFGPDLAEEVFEQAVNLGVGRATKHLQQVLNALNYKEQWGPDLKIDSAFGPTTLARLQKAKSAGREKAVQFGINGLQCAWYVDLALKNATNRKFAAGWLMQRGVTTR